MIIRARKPLRDPEDPDHVNLHLTPAKEYTVVGVSNDSYRVIDDAGEPILYAKCLFEVIDRSIPAGWSLWEYEDGEYHLEPAALNKPGFYERYFDHVEEARQLFDDTIRQMGITRYQPLGGRRPERGGEVR